MGRERRSSDEASRKRRRAEGSAKTPPLGMAAVLLPTSSAADATGATGTVKSAAGAALQQYQLLATRQAPAGRRTVSDSE